MGRPSVFAPKDPKARYQGLMTKAGSAKFEQARRELAELAQMKVRQISDGDVFEYLARCTVDGVRSTRDLVLSSRK